MSFILKKFHQIRPNIFVTYFSFIASAGKNSLKPKIQIQNQILNILFYTF